MVGSYQNMKMYCVQAGYQLYALVSTELNRQTVYIIGNFVESLTLVVRQVSGHSRNA